MGTDINILQSKGDLKEANVLKDGDFFILAEASGLYVRVCEDNGTISAFNLTTKRLEEIKPGWAIRRIKKVNISYYL